MLRKLNYKFKKYTYKYSDSLENEEAVNLYWWKGTPNLGDALNKSLVEKISNKKVIWADSTSNFKYYMAVGSVLQLANPNTEVWGSGLISKHAKPLFKPNKIHAVRGPLTRKILLDMGFECPKVYGDPAILLPRYFNINTTKKYKIGIIPHFVDKFLLPQQKDLPDYISVIDIETTDVISFLNAVCECEMIVSSSLHGIVIADAYGIPSSRVCFSNNISGGDFKFCDYSLSAGRKKYQATNLIGKKLDKSLTKLNFELGSPDCEPLLSNCPFGLDIQ